MTVITESTANRLPATVATPEQTLVQDPASPQFYENPAAHYREWHQRGGPLWWDQLGVWCLTSYDDVNAALRDRKLKRLAPGDGDNCRIPEWPLRLKAFARTERYSLLALEGPAHARLRRCAAKAFGSHRIAALEADIRAIAHTAVDAVETAHADSSGENIDLLALWASPIPVTVIARLLGVPEDEGPQLVAWSNDMVRMYTLAPRPADMAVAENAAAAFETRLTALVRDRRRQPRSDLISDLCAPTSDGEYLEDEEIVSLVILLLNAGHEATVHQLGNAVVTLLQHPTLDRQALFEDPASRDRVVEELGRYRTPLHLFYRYAQQDMTLSTGVKLHRGERLGLLLGAANHDPARFDAPWRFDPYRRDVATLGFGAGVHYCLGVHLARLEMGIALEVLFSRLPQLALAGTPEVSNTWHFHGLKQLQVYAHQGNKP